MTKTPRFELPGKWGRINLTSDAASRKSIRRLTEDVTNRREELATTRAELRGRFQKAADVAREGGATDLYIGLELAPGLPLPAWITVFDVQPTGDDFFERMGLQQLAAALDLAVGSAPAGGERTSGVLPETTIHAVRQTWRRTRQVVEDDVALEFDLIEADYWLAAANPSRMAMITFSTAYAEYEEEMLGLFDAVVSTIRWDVTAPEEAVEA